MVPTSLGENVSTFSTEASVRETPNCDSPLCSRVINITWLSFAPFISQPKNSTRQTEKLDGVFYSIIGRAVQFCCKHFDNRGTRFEYTHKAENIDTLHANIFYDKASIGMPVYIENEFFDQQYGGTLAFIKVLESPGLVVIGNKDDVKQNHLKVLWKTIYKQWPIVLISVLLCAISGICVWALETTWNTDEFPRRFHRGAFEGFWWAFVTMSTVGYGDKAPKSVIARLFSIVWIMVGLTVCSVLTATLTTALATAAVKDVDLVGKKIAVLKGSPAFQEVIKQGASPTLFDNFEDMQKALLNKTVTGIMDEMYHGLYWMQQVRDSRLNLVKIIERTRSYGFAFKKDTIFQWPAEDCIRNLILHRREDVYSVMKQFKDEMKILSSLRPAAATLHQRCVAGYFIRRRGYRAMETSNHITTLEFKILCPPSFEFSILNLELN
ncbi:uncharacterized protein [Porites lutea]|uniref:uncharacterized protein n=1 Tax=Porites lutea TaxID=51062 RepID=UPI003CC6AB09